MSSDRGSGSNGEFNDYIYHNMGSLADVSPTVTASHVLASQQGLLSGYKYFVNERSASTSADIKARFVLNVKGQPEMNLWMPAANSRTIFAVDAPLNNAIRDAIDPNLRGKPMPTLIVRQTGEAWVHPFVAVYEPSLGEEATIQSVRTRMPAIILI